MNDDAQPDLVLDDEQAATVTGGRKAKHAGGKASKETPEGFVHIPATATAPSTYISVAALDADPNAPSVDPNATES